MRPEWSCQRPSFVDQLLQQCGEPGPKPEWITAELEAEGSRFLGVDQDLISCEADEPVGALSVLKDEAAGDAVDDVL
ncbi:hypothetical protein [Streptomyces avermitilis]|uniref:hypothetical protein n=1 Tax=Streptomyces avermitilis TaxID=33903 RepID=UPI00367F743F